MAEQQTALATTGRKGVVQTFAERFDVDATKVMSLVANTVFKPGKDEAPLTNEEVAAALIVCNAYDLNPFTKEIYAFRSKGKLLIVVGVDGWSTIVNRQLQLNGIEFEEHFRQVVDGKTGEVMQGPIIAVTCKIHRKDCALPIVVTEYTHECKRSTQPWETMPIRMTRNRAFVQCARIAFSISGIVDDDEARTIEGNPEFGGRAIIDASANKNEAVRNIVKSKAKAVSAPAQTQQVEQHSEPEPETAESAAEDNQTQEQPEHAETQQTNGKAAASYF